MILKQNKSTLYYIEEQKISEYELLLKYNPLIINRKIRSIEMQIEESYHLNVSHMTCDEVRGIIAVSFPIDKLVIWISEKKADLKRFKNDSSVRLSLLKQVLNTYTKEEQKQGLDTCNQMAVLRRMSLLNDYRYIYTMFILTSL